MLRTAAKEHSVDPEFSRALTKGFNHCELRSVEFHVEEGRPLRMVQENHYQGGMARLWLFPVNFVKQKGGQLVHAAWGWVGGRKGTK